MGSTWRALSDSSAKPTSEFFVIWGKVRKKPLHQAHRRVHRHQLESDKKVNLVLGENREDVHLKQGQRSAPQSAQKCLSWRKASLLNSVWEENLKDQGDALHDEELECRRAPP